MSEQRNLADVVDIIIAGLAERGYMIVKADEIASLRAKLESARRSLTDIVNETSLGVSITIAVHALAALTDEKST